MKVYVLISIILIGLLSACYKEDPIVAELGGYQRVYDTTSSDPVIKYISKYYYKYAKTLIIDPDSVDYLFNFQNKNEIVVTQMPKERYEDALGLMRELFLDSYSEKAIKSIFPFSIIMADSIYSITWSGKKVLDCTSSTGFVAFSCDKGKLNMTEKQKYDYSLKMHMELLGNYCMNNGRINISDEFYAVCKDLYGKNKPFPTIEEAYGVGFVEIVKDGFWYNCPSQTEDLQQWIKFLLTTPQSEIDKIVATYGTMKTKYTELSKALLEVGVDYNNLVYKMK